MTTSGAVGLTSDPSTPQVLLVCWSGADWDVARELMAAGHLPYLEKIRASGTVGAVVGYAPFVSPMLWGTVATGKDPEQHGIHGFEADTVPQTKALWTILSERGKHCAVIGWPALRPSESFRGVFVADTFARQPAGSVSPADREADLSELRLSPSEVDPGLLGLFFPRLREMDLRTDRRPAQLLEKLAELYSFHNTAVTLAAEGQADFLTVHLPFLDGINRKFMAFHLPSKAEVNPRDFEHSRQVVTGAYRLLDALLGDLLRHCPPDINVLVVSDHGFANNTPRPHGLLAASGPGIRRGTRAEATTLADVSPTILALFGLAQGADMPGRILAEILCLQEFPSTIPSWDLMPPVIAPSPEPNPKAWSHDLGVMTDSQRETELLKRSNLGIALIAWGRPEGALPYLQGCFLTEPESFFHAFQLARCQLLLGLREEADRTAVTLEDFGDSDPRVCHLRAELALLSGRFSTALAFAAKGSVDKALARDCGRIIRTALIHLRRFPEAADSLEAALAAEPGHALLHAGLATVRYHQKNWPAATQAAERALELQPGQHLAKRVLEGIARRRHGSPPARDTTWPELTARALRRRRWREESAAREKQGREDRQRFRQTATPIVLAGFESPPESPFHLIVSGAPRSGTSLLLRMLAMAGVRVLTDGVRPPDDHNPHGYFEWEPAKRLPHEPELIAQAAGKAVKVISSLLPHLPENRYYRVLFLRRDVDEIVRSQRDTLPPENTSTAAELARHIEDTLTWAKNAAHVDLLEVPFAELVRCEPTLLARLAEFVGTDRLKRPEAMPRAVQRELLPQPLESSPHA